MKLITLLPLVLCAVLCGGETPPALEIKQEPELLRIVRTWADKLGGELWHFGEFATRRNLVIDSYKQTNVVIREGEQILSEIHNKVKNMMDKKIFAVQRIMEVAENSAVSSDEVVSENFQYYNVKKLINLTPNETFQPENNLEDQERCQYKEVKKRIDRKFNAMRKMGPLTYRDLLQNDELVEGGGGGGVYQELPQRDQEVETSEETEPQEEEIVPKVKNVEQVVTDESGGGGGDDEEDPRLGETSPENKTLLSFIPNPHFFNIPVNTDHSAVHVPSNVYDGSTEVLKGIKWSEELDNTFRSNYKLDPTLSWQYFGSSTGFMRQYPAMQWHQIEESVDLYDCRTRPWFIEAAASPKDMLILVDRSGSMTGMRKEIARHVVNNILDTLGNNDFVNIFTFSNTTDPLVECFTNMMVQANLANIRLFKESMNSFKTEQIADFEVSLTLAFQLLKEYRDYRLGAQCNQAIMLITDGVPYNFWDLFAEYNWKYKTPVRVFTYLIGREVSDVRYIQWMACANKGYYVHLSEFAEVREQVLKYIPVMSRPMVLHANERPNPTWSPVYADVADPKLTNWLWTKRQRREQKQRFDLYKKSVKSRKDLSQQAGPVSITMDHDLKYVHNQRRKNQEDDYYGEMQSYTLMTSVSVPVYDRRLNATPVANLLGVAGTDIPVRYIQRLLMPYALGVNAYAFIVSNNGYILIHPDLRPVFQGILKPAYNRVDMIEIEIEDNDREPRDFTEQIIELRKKVVMQEKGKKMLHMKSHIDDMRRIILGKRHFYHMGIGSKGEMKPQYPFSLVVAIPDNYGFARVHYDLTDDIHRMRSNNKEQPRAYFQGRNWKIHPDWLYCKYLQDADDRFDSPEEEFLHFLKRIECPKWRWSTNTRKIDDPPPKEECERNLVNSLVVDAKITSWFNKNISEPGKDEKGNEFIQKFGITVAFLATSSGLTRWQDFPQNTGDMNLKPDLHFSELHKSTIDEVWYKRAVIQYTVEPMSFVYSVPFDVGEDNETLVTASHAVFREDAGKKAPAAVVGYQFFHTALFALFRNITSSCGEIRCKRTCSSDELDCYVLDNNGYVVVGDRPSDTGIFFGKIRPDIMLRMVKDDIYKKVMMFDYQATCFQSSETSSPAARFLTPLAHFYQVVQWTLGTLYYFVQTVRGEDPGTISYGDEGSLDGPTASDQPPTKAQEKDFEKFLIKKTKPTPCDTKMWMYYLVHAQGRDYPKSPYNRPLTENCDRNYIVQPVGASNLVLLVINNVCPWEKPEENVQVEPEEVEYENMTLPCYRVLYNNYTRRQYMSCINYHEKETGMLCGRGSTIVRPDVLVASSLLLVAVVRRSFVV